MTFANANMHKLETRIPPPIVAGLFALLIWSLGQFENWAAPISILPRIAFVTMVAGSFFCAAGLLTFFFAKTTINPIQPEKASKLIQTGIYGISRNPMYLGLALLLLALSLKLATVLGLVAVVTFMQYLLRFQIIPEERSLQQNFGTQYSAYRARVRRWL